MSQAQCQSCGALRAEAVVYCVACAAEDSGNETMGGRLTLESVVAGQYEIRGVIGHGGMGSVYKAYDRTLDREVALKILPEPFCLDRTLVERFLREAKLAAQLDHPNIVPIYAVGTADGIHFIVMKLVHGKTLRWLIKNRQLTMRRAIPIIAHVCDALDAIHRTGFVHRDIKSSNIMVGPDGRTTVLDFGVLRGLEGSAELTHTGHMVGTPFYMAPEQARDSKHVDHRSDIYSLGVVMYETFTGLLPFRAAESYYVIVQHNSVAPVAPELVNHDVSPALSSVILRTLAKEKDDRYQSATDLKNELLSASTVSPLPDNIPSGQELAPADSPVGQRAKAGMAELGLEATRRVSGHPSERGGSRDSTAPAAHTHPGSSSVFGESRVVAAGKRRTTWIAISMGAIAAAGGFFAVTLAKKAGTDHNPPVAAPATAPAPASATAPAPAAAPASAPASAPAPATAPAAAPATADAPAPASAPAPVSLPPRPRALPATARLEILATENGEHSWGTVAIGGKNYGPTPVKATLAPGRHVVKLTKDGFPERSKTIVLKAGQKRTMTIELGGR